MRYAGAALAAIVMCLPAVAHAEAVDVPAMIKLVETQPADMDRATWREKRRDAAKKLGQSKDKRAVAVLMRVAESETFDIVGELAIEALGALGDPQAVPLLQKIAVDNGRDASQRELAKKALAKLGAKVEPKDAGGGKTPTPTPTPGPTTTTTPSPDTMPATPPPAGDGSATTVPPPPDLGEGKLLGGAPTTPDVPALPVVDDDALAASERLTFATGAANLAYDSVRKRADLDANLDATYSKRVERPTLAYGWDGAAHVVAGFINPTGPAQTRGTEMVLSGDGEARGYSNQLYGVVKGAVVAQFDYVSDVANDGTTRAKDTRFAGDVQGALGGGWGRVIDAGASIRVRRLARALASNRALGRPIDAGLARKLQLTWWALRGERTSYRALIATVAILREAGVLLGEPDAGLSYEILNVLRDSQLYARPVGLDLQVAVGEGYLRRPDMAPGESGRVEQALALASYGRTLDDDKLQASGTGYARLRLFASDGAPAPWAIGAIARMQRFTYGEHGDPLGALDGSVEVGLSDDDVMNSHPALRVAGSLGVTYWVNQASGLRLAATAAVDTGVLFLGAQFSATYGLLDGTFSR